MTFQDVILSLQAFWAREGCLIQQPYDVEVGAGTFNPATFFRVLGPEPWRVASRRAVSPPHGRPVRREPEPSPALLPVSGRPQAVSAGFSGGLSAILAHLGINPLDHDIRFVEDDWESPTLGAWGLGWEVWLDGMEITQFTYFQQVGGIELKPVSVELTYGLERIAMYLQGVENVFDLEWAHGIKYGEIHHEEEVQFSKYNFEEADTSLQFALFDRFEAEAKRLLDMDLVLPAYDYCLKCSHTFNMLDARGAISVNERTRFIARVRHLSRNCAEGYLAMRGRMGHPLLSARS